MLQNYCTYECFNSQLEYILKLQLFIATLQCDKRQNYWFQWELIHYLFHIQKNKHKK